MKAYTALVGTVLLATMNVASKERLNYGQIMVLTPTIAGSVGLSYDELWKALSKEHSIPFGAPIQVRLVTEKSEPLPVSGPVVTLPIEQVVQQVDRNVFVKG